MARFVNKADIKKVAEAVLQQDIAPADTISVDSRGQDFVLPSVDAGDDLVVAFGWDAVGEEDGTIVDLDCSAVRAKPTGSLSWLVLHPAPPSRFTVRPRAHAE